MVRLETAFLGLFAAGVLVGFVACAEIEFGSTASYKPRDYEKVIPPNMVDILMVVDNSGSMLDDQRALRRGFSGFTGKLDSLGLDHKIGVVTTFLDPNNSSANRNIREVTPSKTFYSIMEDIGRDTQLCPQGSFSCSPADARKRNLFGKEKGIDRAIEVIKNNNSFFRNEAELVIIFLSDEDSGCEIEDYDNSRCEKYYSNHKNADDLIKAVKSRFTSDKHFTAHSIVDTGTDNNCTKRHTEGDRNPIVGKLYMEASTKTEGLSACLYANTYDTILSNIADDIAVQSIQLDCVPFENAELSQCFNLYISENYVSDPGYPRLEGSKLILSPSLTSGQLITLKYWCANYEHTSLPDLEQPCQQTN